MLSARIFILPTMLVNSVFCNSVTAGELLLPPGFITQSTIDGKVTDPGRPINEGVVTVNIASGEQNAQANLGSIALNLQSAAAKVNLDIQQAVENNQSILPNQAKAEITGNSFSNSVGWIAVNQASGLANAQVNAFSFSEGSQVMTDTRIKQTITGDFKPLAVLPVTNGTADTELDINGEFLADNALQETLSGEQPLIDGGLLRAQRAISVEDTAFRNTLGVVQLNQSAGSGNRSINNFALRVIVDAK
ncbi:MAG: hypothetical protein GQ532_14450, partial [Methylomarinum sp.]|nr:hypothetical protein [Methylomarinum sp.]